MSRRLFLASIAVAAVVTVACGESYREADTAAPADGGLDASASLTDSSSTLDSAVIVSDADSGEPADASSKDAAVPDPCDAGYVQPPNSSACVLANPFQDPSFVSGTPWSVTHGAAVIATAQGVEQLGVARLAETRKYGRVTQSISLPPDFVDLPLAFTVVGRYTSDYSFPGYLPIGITADGFPLLDWSPNSRPGGSGKFEYDVCLGEAALYGTRSISFRGIELSWKLIDLDRVGMKLAPGQCPPRATIPNGDFEDKGAWKTNLDVTFDDGIGVGGSRGLHFHKTTTSVSSAYEDISVPSVSMASPAVQLHVLGKADLSLGFGSTYTFAYASVDGADTVKTYCLPEWSKGIVDVFKIASGGGGFQNDTSETGQDFVIDDLKFVNDPKCAQKTFLENWDFEAEGEGIPAWYTRGRNGYAITRGTASPHGGAGYLAMNSTPASCAGVGGLEIDVHQWVRVPDFDDSKEGPRYSFWYRYTAGATGAARAQPGENLDAAPTWTKVTRCIGNKSPGARVRIGFSLEALQVGCTSSSFDVDDLVVDVDSSCQQ